VGDYLSVKLPGFKSGEGFMKWTQEEIDACNADLNSYLIHMLYER